ncbi:tetraacyldisaccharide 4'-kinase [Wenyingzhuangia sp. 2_MG-2023]|uniref:tetraacyldisaccharide 4'-kinase n=1 Tax=Wenyingzhuangia sp. 2_MG-2023 TaxID=3062639 RepID=UPI003014AD47
MNVIFVLRVLLFPFSVLYASIVVIRNLLFDTGVLKSTSFDLPIITVGNLSVGGTGKTPQIEYLIRLLRKKHKIAVLSRGYKRKSKGFVLANPEITVANLGDEPYQYYKKFDDITVAVDGNRVEGVQKIRTQKPLTEIILLDDAYQHRKIKAGYQILLTSYHDLFYKDFMMPTGNLRELWWGKKRADSIVVTKCPEDLSVEEQQNILRKIAPNKNQQVYFTKITYADSVFGTSEISLKDLKDSESEGVVLVTGIAKPKPLMDYLTFLGIEFEHLKFSDHHNFSVKELGEIHEKSISKKIITTEKDYVRLQDEIDNLYYLPIEIQFLNRSDVFDTAILDFIKQ